MNTTENTETTAMTNRRLAGFLLTVRAWAAGLRDDDRGDVPGWVMITLMSAMLVAGLMVIAGDALKTLFEQAISQVAP
ncbi:hypothetical protein [Micrococcus sp. IITD107]|uniref:hypothetical protein n=1 Tax=Micrococcus sp. IITD107 TaxID=3342790 RepID=UPI0035B77013